MSTNGGYAGSAYGFRMSSLLKLVDTKANKPGMNLMHYVAMQAQEIDASLLKFPDQLPHIGEAARISKQEVETNFQREMENFLKAQEIIRKQQELQVQMKTFFKRAESKLAEVESSLQMLSTVTNAVAEYFCEDPSIFKLDECCSIFHSFCERFACALQENHEREAAEARRRQQERQRTITKRRSTATCSSLDRDLEGMALETLLHTFLTNRGSRRKAGQFTLPEVRSLKELCEGEMTPGEQEIELSKWSSTQDVTDEQGPRDMEEKWSETMGHKRLPSINDTLTPKCRDLRPKGLLSRRNSYSSFKSMHSPFSLEEGEEEEVKQKEENAEEFLWMRETPSKASTQQAGSSSLFCEGTPLRSSRSLRETLLMPLGHLQQEDGISKTILSPRPSPNITPKSARRHTIAMTLSPSWAYIDEPRNLPASPGTPIRTKHPPLAVVGKMKSADSVLSSPTTDDTQDNPEKPNKHFPACSVNEEGPLEVPASSNTEPRCGVTELAPNSRLGHLFHRRSKPQASRTERQESSAFISFFRRLGERGSRHSDGELDSQGTDS
ncbi:FH2 domain-containing protein 1-like [Arapaima gigas]